MPADAAGGGDEEGQEEVSEQLLKGQAMGMILLRCQDVLRHCKEGLTTYELQLALANSNPSKIYTVQYYVQLFSDPVFIGTLRKNSRLLYEPRTRKWHFRSPYAGFTSVEALLEGVEAFSKSHANGGLGLEITQELLDANPKMTEWIYQILEAKKVRAVRTGKPTKCKSFAPDSGFVCNIYDKRSKKCESCNALRNLTFFPKARPDSDNPQFEAADENFHIDDDIKELWNNVKLPEMRKIMEEIRNKDKMKKLEVKKKPRRRGCGNENGSGRVNKIANLHIYSLEDYKTELSNAGIGEEK